jgi:hypothetical protein
MKVKCQLLRFLLSVFTLLVLCIDTKAQVNLVPNPSFEDTLGCPHNYLQIQLAQGWSSFKETPDYFNSCDSNLAGVPNNDPGFQYARTGNGYAGLLPFAHFGQNGREIIGIQLTQPLVIGEQYYVSFYVSRAVGIGMSACGTAVNKLGARFSTVSYSQPTPTPINNFAHIYTDSIVRDTTNWVQVSGNFIADSTYQYLGLGNFFTDTLTSFELFDTIPRFAYYFIDDVSVTEDPKSDVNENESNRDKTFIYPNPTNGFLSVYGKNLESYILYDSIGKNLLAGFITNYAIFNIDLNAFKAGTYYLKIFSEKNISIHKIILT